MTEGRCAVKVQVVGHVQGVYYRGWTQREATRLGLGGWVRNEHDLSVSALLVGPRDAVGEMLRLMHRGPLNAHVEKVVVEETSLADAPHSFSVLR